MNRLQAILVLLFLSVVTSVGGIFFFQAKTTKETGLASWYGSDAGSMTASGETYDPKLLTAAHRKLAFDTIVRVTNQENGRSVKVRINDRGPFTGGRILDVSSAAADKLDMKAAGVVKVDVEVVETPQLEKKP